MKNEQMNLEMLYTEIAAASSVDFSDKIHEWIKASANTYGTLEEINRLEDIKTLLLKGIEENKILKVVELGKEKLILEAILLTGEDSDENPRNHQSSALNTQPEQEDAAG